MFLYKIHIFIHSVVITFLLSSNIKDFFKNKIAKLEGALERKQTFEEMNNTLSQKSPGIL